MKELNWRLILPTAGVLGLIAGVLPMILGPQWLYTTMPIVMMISIYFLTPRVQENRLQTGVTASVLSAVITLGLYFVYQYAMLPAADATNNLKAAIGQFFMLVLVISVGGSWFFVKVHEWAEKKRVEMESKQQARGGRVARRLGNADEPKKKFSQMSMQEKFKKKEAQEDNIKK